MPLSVGLTAWASAGGYGSGTGNTTYALEGGTVFCPQALAPLQRSLQLHMDSIARLDATIHALCLRRSQAQATVVAEQLRLVLKKKTL